MSDPQESYVFEESPSPPSSDEVDSLPESGSTSSSGDGEPEFISDAEQQWKESLQQMELLLTMVLIPACGKYFGRKLAFWSWAKYMTWRYPVEIVVTNPAEFRAAGIIGAAAPL